MRTQPYGIKRAFIKNLHLPDTNLAVRRKYLTWQKRAIDLESFSNHMISAHATSQADVID